MTDKLTAAEIEHLRRFASANLDYSLVRVSPLSLRALCDMASASRPALFQAGEYRGASGQMLDGKIECDALSDEEIATLAGWIAARAGSFSEVEGVPRGGLRLAEALKPYATPHRGPLLIVDDVWTTGGSMKHQRAGREAKGFVLFARGPLTPWCGALFSMASASLASAGDGEVEELARVLRSREDCDSRVRCDEEGGCICDAVKKAADTLARQQAEIASLRERVVKAEAEVCQLDAELNDERQARRDAERHAAESERRVAELARVVEFYADQDNWYNPPAEGDRVASYRCGATHVVDMGGNGLPTAICDRGAKARQALTAAQGEEPAPDKREITADEMMDCYQFGKVDCPPAGEGEAAANLDELVEVFGPAPRRLMNKEPAPDHTAAIREAMGALETIRDLPRSGTVLDSMEMRKIARATHAKLTEIIEG